MNVMCSDKRCANATRSSSVEFFSAAAKPSPLKAGHKRMLGQASPNTNYTTQRIIEVGQFQLKLPSKLKYFVLELFTIYILYPLCSPFSNCIHTRIQLETNYWRTNLTPFKCKYSCK